MPPPKHSRATVPALYVLTLVEGLAALKVPDRPTDRGTEGGEEMIRSCKKKGKKKKGLVGRMDNEGKDERRCHLSGGEMVRGEVQRIHPVLKGREKEQRGRYERVGTHTHTHTHFTLDIPAWSRQMAYE